MIDCLHIASVSVSDGIRWCSICGSLWRVDSSWTLPALNARPDIEAHISAALEQARTARKRSEKVEADDDERYITDLLDEIDAQLTEALAKIKSQSLPPS